MIKVQTLEKVASLFRDMTESAHPEYSIVLGKDILYLEALYNNSKAALDAVSHFVRVFVYEYGFTLREARVIKLEKPYSGYRVKVEII